MTHTTTARAVRSGLLAAAALLLTCATPAPATADDALGDNWFYLTVTQGDAKSAGARSALLQCDPPKGHSRAETACAELGAAAGDIAAIPRKDGYCPTIYAPVTAHARGKWRGQPVEYRQTFSNACMMAARTGSVFALDS
ncbi:SSI family serine proteinase inhibitor [Streptomyces sp. S.PNR 29]|uniref:SSI family serine proteinase inhibitor n=1 Tax=Streptomyces sp. S.PNR 29 TaxID=2973805 RepID=UPI0025B02A0E|nr:SSI family serine proteinase inhibitor [Streptomyces sp. S.PNR 29]MDN0197286.1 subtilase-type protease inhibitor [Streptomyces sp. S.PNR 29]